MDNARTTHECNHCNHIIEIGDSYEASVIACSNKNLTVIKTHIICPDPGEDEYDEDDIDEFDDLIEDEDDESSLEDEQVA